MENWLPTVSFTPQAGLLLLLVGLLLLSVRKGRRSRSGSSFPNKASVRLAASRPVSAPNIKTDWSAGSRTLYVTSEANSIDATHVQNPNFRVEVYVKLKGKISIPLNPSAKRTFTNALDILVVYYWSHGDSLPEGFFETEEFYFGDAISLYTADASYFTDRSIAPSSGERARELLYHFDFNGEKGDAVSAILDKERLAKLPAQTTVQTAGYPAFRFTIASDMFREWSERYPDEFLKFTPPETNRINAATTPLPDDDLRDLRARRGPETKLSAP